MKIGPLSDSVLVVPVKEEQMTAGGINISEPALQDERSESRNPKAFQLKYETYNTESDTFEISDGIAHNYSANGLYFETKNPFQPGDPVCLSSKDLLSGKCESEFAIGVHAQIVWCKLLNMGFDQRYGVGVKYFEPIESHIESH